MSKYAHNKSTANVSLIDGSILLAVGGKSRVTDSEANHVDTIHAIRMGWISVEGEESAAVKPSHTNGIEFTVDPMKGSATIPVVKSKITATSTPIGVVESVTEATSITKTKKSKSKDKVEE